MKTLKQKEAKMERHIDYEDASNIISALLAKRKAEKMYEKFMNNAKIPFKFHRDGAYRMPFDSLADYVIEFNEENNAVLYVDGGSNDQKITITPEGIYDAIMYGGFGGYEMYKVLDDLTEKLKNG